ncbi:MAG: hypothetical protein DRR11_04315 [Gammaproteobacteria bacterium]|nr:MAG: hypothetical protein DRR11_04315 [Gammaproteobacteria bacterium]RLA35664.1 MAG: hypothetical protein DRR15_06980 [Gammaproteobacteria bacterium]
MITHEQGEQAANSILEQPGAELGSKQEKMARQAAAAQKRCASPLIPALTAALTTIAALGFLESTLISALLGAAVGGLFGWAARRY